MRLYIAMFRKFALKIGIENALSILLQMFPEVMTDIMFQKNTRENAEHITEAYNPADNTVTITYKLTS